MALTRRMLKAMGISDEQVDEIIAAHTETVDALKEQRDQYRADSEKLTDVQKQLEKATADLEASGKDAYRERFENLKAEYDEYKRQQAERETREAKERAYRSLLLSAGVSERRIDAILRVTDLDSIELLEDGKIKDSDRIADNIKSEWADFIQTATTQGAQTATPPENASAKSFSQAEIRKMSPDEINKNWETIKNSLNSKGD